MGSKYATQEGLYGHQKKEKHLFDVEDLVNVLNSMWTEDDSVFIYKCMRVQMSFLFLVYCFTGARVGIFLDNAEAQVQREDGQIDTLVFQGLTWTVR